MLKELRVQLIQNEVKNSDLISSLVKKRTFEMENYSKNIKTKRWKSPAMYTHACGYKFRVGVSISRANNLCVALFSVPGEFDGQLNWPANTKFTIELVNQQRGKNAVCTDNTSWAKSTHESLITYGLSLVDISRLDDFLVNDTLYFHTSIVELL